MKKLLTLFVLLYALAAQSQAITEKDLLGRWNFIALGSEGNYLDFEKDSIYMTPGNELSDVEKRDIFKPGGLKDEITRSYIKVLPGFKVLADFGMEGFEETAFDFVQEEGRYYISNGYYRMEIALKGSLLHLYMDERGTYAVLRKQNE
jgi:hypothetical protein